MPRWLKIFLIVLVFFTAGAIALLRTPRPLEYVLAKVLQRQIPDAKINSVNISEYHLKDQQAFLDQVSIDFSLKGVDYLVHSDQVNVGSWRALLGNFSNDFTVKGLHLVSKDIKFSNGVAKIRYETVSKKEWVAQGHARFPVGSYIKQGIMGLEFDFVAKPKSFTFKDIQANAFKGKINGEFMLEYKAELPYSMDILFTGIDTTVLPPQVDISQQFKGVIDGTLRVTGDVKNIKQVEAKINAPKGAFASADFLRLFTFFTRMSGDPYTKVVEVAINLKNEHFLETFNLELKNVGNEKLSSDVNFKSKSSNLDFHATYDINLDAELGSLFQSGQQLMDFYKKYFEKK